MRAQPDYPLVTAAIEVFADWWKQQRDRTRDLDFVTASELDTIAKDIGVSAADLRKLDRRGSDLLLPRMMAALHLDPTTLKQTDPALFRDLQRVCALCDCQNRCARTLAEGDAAATYEAYCPNALSLKALA